MTTLLEATSGSLILRDTDGSIVFDSDEKLFQATNRAVGSVTRGPWTATKTWPSTVNSVDADTNTFLQSVNAACNTVVGSFKLTSVGSPAYGVGGLGWFNAGGSYVHYQQGLSGSYALIAFTFFCSGGGLYLKERVLLAAQTPTGSGGDNLRTHQVLALTFDYNLYCGSFV